MRLLMMVATAAVLLCGRLATTEATGRQKEADPPSVAVLKLEGSYLRALLIASDALRNLGELSDAQKNVVNYRIILSEDGTGYMVHFVPHRAASEPAMVGGETSLGKEVRFTVRKGDFKLVERVFFE